MKTIELNKSYSNRCPRCDMMVRYCNCDIIQNKGYTKQEIEYINMQKDGRKRYPTFEEWRD